MLVRISSNLVGGVYTTAELLLMLLLTRMLTFGLEVWNLYVIYDKREQPVLHESPLRLFGDHGLSTRKAVVLTTTVSAAATVLLAAGAFGLVGETEDRTEPVVMKDIVLPAHDDVVDYRDEVFFDKNTVSGRVRLALTVIHCTRAKPDVRHHYAVANDLPTIDEPQDSTGPFLNSTCVTEESGFKNVKVLEFKRSFKSNEVQSRECKFQVDVARVAAERVATRVDVVQEPGCHYPVKDMWCVRNNGGVFCAALLAGPPGKGGFSTSTHVVENGEQKDNPSTMGMEKQLHEDSLKSMASLMSVSTNLLASLTVIHFVRVSRDVTVQRIAGERSVTRVKKRLFTGTVGAALVLVAGACVAVVWGWVVVVFRRGRRKYNRFNSARDLLSCAIVEARRSGGCRFRTRGEVVVGVCADGSQVVVEGNREGSVNL